MSSNGTKTSAPGGKLGVERILTIALLKQIRTVELTIHLLLTATTLLVTMSM